ncbi:unnamed protein product [Nezara viridula]|uniref:Uncharacterized protein n=1 Tax=Nezara viridula TaxID=85310 RepID=A0A9P0MTM7_NEZVI|nr:unnamed protein product [Nezara viridula]
MTKCLHYNGCLQSRGNAADSGMLLRHIVANCPRESSIRQEIKGGTSTVGRTAVLNCLNRKKNTKLVGEIMDPRGMTCTGTIPSQSRNVIVAVLHPEYYSPDCRF